MQPLKFLAKRLAPFFVFFAVLEFVVRMALTYYSWADLGNQGARFPAVYLVGLGYDIVAFIYMAIPIAFYALVLPVKCQGSRADKIISSALFFIFTYVLMFSAVGEWFFWDEFQSRYNFIAVDYLVYTTEVIGNIRESYPEGILMSIMAVISSALTFLFYKFSGKFLSTGVFFKQRMAAFTGLILLSIISFNTAKPDYAEISENRTFNEIGRNGIYELFSAYLDNELDFNNFYVTRPLPEVEAFLKSKLGTSEKAGSPLYKKVEGKADHKKYNLVFITVESLSARFLKEFGNEDNVTPHLDALIDKSLFFSNLYATGTRTVYGLSALTLSMPPVPGNSIVRRPENDNLHSIGGILASKGYDTKFIYGGFGYFDNMNKFFAGNGYKIVDRNNLSKQEIHFANIWGVADDDVYRRALKENDAAYAAKKPFFDMIMTTSNHRPFTFPDGKIDLPSNSGRKGGVKFTDFAIHEFLTEAKKKPWFKDTIFVIVADHTASSSGKTELEPKKYRIPMWIYAPGIVKPGKVDWMASQIDVVPTVLGLMGVSYDSYFYGVDLMKTKPERVFISNYQKLGYMTKQGLLILEPVDQVNFYKPSQDGYKQSNDIPQNLVNDAIGYYQGAAQWKDWSKQKKLK